MKIFRKGLQKLGFAEYSDFTKASFINHNVRALRTTCIIAGASGLLFLILSLTDSGYAVPLIRIISLLTIAFTAVIYILLKYFNQERVSFHFFHSMILVIAMVLSTFGIVISLHDCANGGGLMVFFITQMWIFDMLLIPPFVSIVLAGIDFTVFLSLVAWQFRFPLLTYLEAGFFYLTLTIINYFHYNTALQQTYEEENVIRDNEYLMNISTTDALTAVRNRAGLEADLSHYRSSDLFVMMMDIDNFKKYNDTYGHPTGDMILRSYAGGLLKTFGFHHVYRYGGDEFLIIKVMNSPEEFDDMIFRAKWIIHHNRSDIPQQTTCSCGYVYGTCNDEKDLKEMIKQADTCLYQAKRKGKNQVASAPFRNPEEA